KGKTLNLSVTGTGNTIGTGSASLKIAATTLNASSQGNATSNIFVDQPLGSLKAGLITAGAGNVNLSVDSGGLTSATVDNAADIVAANLTISVGGSSSKIGTGTGSPLEIDASVLTNATTAGGDMYLKDVSGD